MVETGTWIAIGAVASLLLLGVQLYRGRATNQETTQSAEDANEQVLQQLSAEGETLHVDQNLSLGGDDEDDREQELRDRVRDRLFEDGRLAEAVMYAREFAELKELSDEAEWLKWEELGLVERPAPEIEHEWERRAPYRLIEVELLLPDGQVFTTSEIFLSNPIAEVEERIRLYRQSGDSRRILTMPLENFAPPGSELRAAYPGEEVPFVIREGHLQTIRERLRVEIGRLLDEN